MRGRVFRLISFFFTAACLAAFVWFGLTVDLGERTLFGHLRAIGSSDEAKDLGKGIKAKVDDFVGIEAAKRAAEQKRAGGPPQDEHSAEDREDLRKLIENKAGEKPAARPAGKGPAKPARATPDRSAAGRSGDGHRDGRYAEAARK